MAYVERPAKNPRWADISGLVVEPSEGKKDKGWTPAEKPAAQFFNWILLTIYGWVATWNDSYRGVRSWVTENWYFATAQLATFGYTATISGGGLTITVEDPDSGMRSRYVKITGVTGQSGTLTGLYLHYFKDSSDVDMEFDLEAVGYGTSTDYSFEAGLQFSGGAARRIVVQKTNSSAHWYLHVEAATPGGTSVDSTVTATAGQKYRARLEYRGHSGGNSTVNLWLDGVLVATYTGADAPKNDKARIYLASAENAGLGATLGDFYVAPVSFRAAP
jgi:hypothetical protein